MQAALVQLDLMPLQVAHLRSSHPMTISDQDHRCIAVTVAIVFGGFDQPLDLALGEVAALDCESLPSHRRTRSQSY
jgi:hypothetical protein